MICRGLRRVAAARGFQLIAALLLATLPISSQAALSFTVTINTSALVGNNPPGPFSLDFQFTDSGALGNNTLSVSNFSFGGGSGVGSPTTGIGFTGNLNSGFTLTGNQFLHELTQEFTPGSTLSFKVDMTTVVDSPTPDEFTFAILDSTFAELPTLDPTGFNTFITVVIDSATPTIQAYGSDPNSPPVAGGPTVIVGAPTVNVLPAVTVPLPRAWPAALCAVPLVGMVVRRRRAVEA